MGDRLTPAPEPYLNSMASVLARSMIEDMESWTELMKQLWTETLFERYSPDSVWMSKTSWTPIWSMATIFFLTEGWAGLETADLQRIEQACLLAAVDEADELREARAFAADANRDLVHVLAVMRDARACSVRRE